MSEAALKNPASGDLRLPPQIVDAEAHRGFLELARKRKPGVDSQWVEDYVQREWRQSRHLLESALRGGREREVLEFGCNIGATAMVLAALGNSVTAVDVDASNIELARLNAQSYGLGPRIRCRHVPDTRRLPFAAASFDLICCNSVLEYVPAPCLATVQRELDRVLRPGGLLVILGTSNRLWPREAHSGSWLVNYLPRALDRLLPGRTRRRGVWPWRLRYGFGPYQDLLRQDRGAAYLEAQRRMGSGARKLRLLAGMNACAHVLGVSVGMLTPNACLILKKP